MAQRPPFDPRRIRRPDPTPSGPGDTILTVRQVSEMVRGAIARHVPPTLHVLGEIGDFTRAGSGHLYFTLKDADSELRSVMWRSAATRLRFELEPGMAVIATGGIEVYAPRGTYQLIVRKLEPRGIGALEIAFRQLKEKLEREGLFDPRRKKPLPRIPERIALVTSPTGAAIRDILQTLQRRFPVADVLLFPVRVQGEGAAAEIAAAIHLLDTHADGLGGIDVAIVGRGGGSLEDLWAFNEEIVARAIAASRVPIISAVGHEVDVTISDLVADLRAPTPTAAAELVAPSRAELLDRLDQQGRRATRVITHAVHLRVAQLNGVLVRDRLARPQAWLGEQRQRVDEIHQRLRLAVVERFRNVRQELSSAAVALLQFRSGAWFAEIGRGLQQRLQRLSQALHRSVLRTEHALARGVARLERTSPRPHLPRSRAVLLSLLARLATAARVTLLHRRRLLTARLEAVTACDPRRVLRRGFSITRDARSRAVIRSVKQIRNQLRIVTELADGEFRSTADDPQQPGLFD